MTETAASVQLGLTFGPLDGALQPSTEEALEDGMRRCVGGGRGGGGQEEDEEGGVVFRAAV